MRSRKKWKEGEKAGWQDTRVTILKVEGRKTTIRNAHGYVQTVNTRDLEDDPGPA